MTCVCVELMFVNTLSVCPGKDVDGLTEAQMPSIPQKSYLADYAKTKVHTGLFCFVVFFVVLLSTYYCNSVVVSSLHVCPLCSCENFVKVQFWVRVFPQFCDCFACSSISQYCRPWAKWR